MTLRRALPALALFVALSSCDAVDDVVDGIAGAEFVRFQYVFATPEETADGLVYRLPAGSEAGCADVARLDGERLVAYLNAVQNDRIGGGCFSTFDVSGDEVADIRQDPALRFRLSRSGQGALAFNVARGSTSINTEPDPIAFLMEPFEGQTEDVASSWGTATFRFGQRGPEFTCESGPDDLPWAPGAEGDTGRNSFFWFETASIGTNPDRASGEFRCVARNAADATDRRLLLIIGGDFQMQF